MAATLVDQLLLELGLDSQKFVKGLKESQDAVKGTREAVEKHGKGIEESMHKAGDSVKELGMRFLELYAILLGARGFSEFVSKTTESDTAIGRLSASIGATSKSVSELDMIAERFGGSSQSMHASLLKLNDIYYDLAINGKALPPVLSQIMALSGTNVSYSQGPIQQMKDLSVAIQKIAQTRGVPLASYLGRQYGLDDPMVQMMIKYGPNLQKKMKELEPLALTEEQVEKAERFEKTWAQLGQNVQFAAHSFWMSLEPAVSSIMDEMIKWLELPTTHTAIVEWTEWLEKELKAAPGWISAASAEWKKFFGDKGGFESIKSGYNDVKNMITGWIKENDGLENSLKRIIGTTQELIALWTGSVFLGILKKMGFGVAGGIGMVGGGIAAGALMLSTSPAGEGEDEAARHGIKKGKDSEPRKESWGDWISKKFINMFDMRAHAEGVKVEGRDVNLGNPMPVWVANPEERGASLYDAARRGRSTPRGHSGAGYGGDDPGGGGKGGSAGVGHWWTPARMAYAYDRLVKEAGLSPMGAAAMVARMATIEAPGGPTSWNNIAGGHWGIAQWSRERGGLAMAHTSYEGQVSHLIDELNNSRSEARAARNLRKAVTEEEGQDGASQTERAGGWNGTRDSFARRTPAAKVLGIIKKFKEDGVDVIGDGHMGVRVAPTPREGPLPPLPHGGDRGRDMPPGEEWYWDSEGHMSLRKIPRTPPTGAGAFLHNHNQQVTHNNTRSETVHVGEIHVHTQAKDAEGIAHNIKEAMRRDRIVRSQEGGMA